MSKLPLLLCPGLLNDAALWSHQIETMADLAEPIVADLTGAETITGVAERVLAAAPPRFALAGLSMGGYVAFEIMRRAPGRVDRLALFDTTARPDTLEGRQRRLDMISIAKRGGFTRIPAQLLANQVAATHVRDPRISGAVFAMAERIGADAFVRQQLAIMTRPDSRPDLPSIAVPTLVVCGREDTITTPEIMGEIAEGIPGAKLVVVEDSGHLTPLEQPHATSALLRYWLQA